MRKTLVPGLWHQAGPVFTLGASACALAYLGASARFAWRQDRASARTLLFVSLVYLPLVLVLAVADPATGAVHAFR